MKAFCISSLVMATMLLTSGVKADSDIDLTNAPPVVVKAVPQAGSDGVDPGITEIKVTYSKDMTDGSWSWSTAGKDNFPQTTGKPHYLDDKRTCVLPVHLEPGKTYAIWLNSQNFGNFKDTDGRAAVPYLLVFKTKAP
jgi:RNA polymerase sigma-70 factor (ECF subfamily)